MERKVEINTADNHSIYGVLNWVEPKSKKLIIFVHGLTSSMDAAQFYNAARFFPEKGFTVFRFNLYGSEKKARDLDECSIRTHSMDVDKVVDFFKEEYDEIYLVGHSLGGPSIIYSSQSVNKIILWDPTLFLDNNDKYFSDYYKFDDILNKYIKQGGIRALIGVELFEEFRNTDLDMVKGIRVPTKIICAGNGLLLKDWKLVLDKIPVENEFVVIDGAGHSFVEEGCQGKLFEETLSFLKK